MLLIQLGGLGSTLFAALADADGDVLGTVAAIASAHPATGPTSGTGR